jgi:flagellar FliL protein
LLSGEDNLSGIFIAYQGKKRGSVDQGEEQSRGGTMAEDSENEEEGSAPAKSGGKKKLIIVGAVVVLLLGGAGAFFMLHHKAKKVSDIPMSPKELEGLVKKNPIIDLKSFVVNLTVAPNAMPKYLKLKVALKLNNPEVAKEIEYRMPEIQNIILILLGSETEEDLSSTGGKLALRNQIQHRINSILTLGRVSSVYFTEFVIQ